MLKRKNGTKRVLVCIDGDLLKRLDELKGAYRNRSDMVRQALEILIAAHRKKSMEREFKKGFKIMRAIDNGFARKSVEINRKGAKEE